MQRRGRHVLRNIKFLLKKKKGSLFEKEESALRVSRDMIPERAASHTPPSKPRSAPETLRVSTSGSRHSQPGKLFQKYITGVPTSQQNRPTWSGMFNLAQDAASTLKSPSSPDGTREIPWAGSILSVPPSLPPRTPVPESPGTASCS